MSCGEPVDCNNCQYRNQPARQNTFELSGTTHNIARNEILQALARGYCAPINSGKELDSNLIIAMADELAKLSPVA